MRSWGWRAPAEEKRQLTDGVGDVDLAIIVAVTRVGTGTCPATKQKGQDVDCVANVTAAICIGITADKENLTDRQLHTQHGSTAVKFAACGIDGNSSKWQTDLFPGSTTTQLKSNA